MMVEDLELLIDKEHGDYDKLHCHGSPDLVHLEVANGHVKTDIHLNVKDAWRLSHWLDAWRRSLSEKFPREGTSDQLKEIFHTIHKIATAEDFVYMDQILFKDAIRCVKVFDPSALVAILRYSFPWRDKLDKWNELRDTVHAEFLNRGHLDATNILRGLY